MYISTKNLKMKAVEETHISTGNKKMEGFLIWSLPSKLTCPYKTEMCANKCYARKAEYLYPQTLPSRQRNFEASQKPEFAKDMIAFITKKVKNAKKYKFDKFRIHESGDFYNREYFEKWLEVVKALPNITFLAFTKSPFVREYLDQLPENFHLYYSIWEDTKKENIVWELPLAIAGNCDKLYKKETFECKGECGKCLHCFTSRRDVHFKIH